MARRSVSGTVDSVQPVAQSNDLPLAQPLAEVVDHPLDRDDDEVNATAEYGSSHVPVTQVRHKPCVFCFADQ